MYIKVVDGNPIHYSPGRLKADNPQVSFPREIPEAMLAVWGVFPVTFLAEPTNLAVTQKATESTITEVEGVWTRGYDVTDKDAEELSAMVLSKVADIAKARFRVEEAGVVWTQGADNFFIDTTLDSQQRVTAAKSALGSGLRKKQKGNTDGVWKLAQLDAEGNPSLQFRPTSDVEITAIAELVVDHVQKCFEVEAICFNKIEAHAAAGEFVEAIAVDFDTEFAAY